MSKSTYNKLFQYYTLWLWLNPIRISGKRYLQRFDLGQLAYFWIGSTWVSGYHYRL